MAANQPLPSPLIFRAPNNIFQRRRRSSHAMITPNGRRQKNGENQSRVRDFKVVALTIFSIQSLYLGLSRDPWYLCPQTDFRPAAASDRSCLLKRSSGEKRTVRNERVLMIFHFFYLPFFQLNCYFWSDRVIRDISAHRRIFAPPPPPPARVNQSTAAMQKERWEMIGFWWFFMSFTHHSFN